MKALNAILMSGREVLPLVEGGKGISVSNGESSGAWAPAGGVGTFSGVNADSYDERGHPIPQIYYGKTRRERVTAEFVMRELQRLWPAQAEKPLISSFAYDSLQVAQRLAPEFPRAVLVEEVPENWQALCKGVEAVALNPWHKTLTAEWTKAIKKAGYKVLSYTVNETARARELFDWGVDSVFSDVPGQLIRELGA